MFRELIRAFFMAGVPVAVTSFLLVWWSLRQGYLGPAGSVRDLEKSMKAMSKKRRQVRKQRKAEKKVSKKQPDTEEIVTSGNRIDPVHNKWLAFGGGFYGIVGLMTYAVVEFGELRDFFLGFESLAALLAQFGFDMLVNLLIDAVMNFVIAIAWPVYWMSEIAMNEVWIWFAVAYFGYWAGVKGALLRFGRAAS
jgi:hypothetical protein